MRIGIALLVLACVTSGCERGMPRSLPSNADRASRPAAVDSIDLAVLSAVLADERMPKPVDHEMLVQAQLEGVSWPDQSLNAWHREELPGLQDATARSFHRRSRAPGVLTAELNPGRPYRLINRSEWMGSRDISGVHVLSRPGYNRERTQALVYVLFACPLCAQASYLLLDRGPAGWTVSAKVITVES